MRSISMTSGAVSGDLKASQMPRRGLFNPVWNSASVFSMSTTNSGMSRSSATSLTVLLRWDFRNSMKAVTSSSFPSRVMSGTNPRSQPGYPLVRDRRDGSIPQVPHVHPEAFPAGPDDLSEDWLASWRLYQAAVRKATAGQTCSIDSTPRVLQIKHPLSWDSKNFIQLLHASRWTSDSPRPQAYFWLGMWANEDLRPALRNTG